MRLIGKLLIAENFVIHLHLNKSKEERAIKLIGSGSYY